MEIENKVTIITGSSSGIGLATALFFAKKRARIVVNSRHNIVGGEKAVKEINANGGQAIYFHGDVSNEKTVKELFNTAYEHFGSVDILINNAGSTISEHFLDDDIKIWEESLNNNLITAVLCSREAAKIMLPQGQGRIINLSSVRGLDHAGRTGIMAYSASKAAIINFTKTLAKELAPNITVNAVAPGFVYTENYEKMDPGLTQSFINATLIKRFISTDEIAQAIYFLVTSDSITGEVLVIDGGFSLATV